MSFVGDLIGGSSDQKASKQAMTGYNYLDQPGIQSQVTNAGAANNAEAQLLGLAPMTAQTQTGMNNYLNSTGYQFNLQQGENAISGNAASRGILNSGSTAKALTQYGQNLGTSYFNNYLNSLGGVNAQGNQIATATGQAGTQGGNNAGNYTSAAGNAFGSAANSGLGALGSVASFFL